MVTGVGGSFAMDKTREFWLRLGVIAGALILMSSAMAAFIDWLRVGGAAGATRRA